jgi:general stress protein 26
MIQKLWRPEMISWFPKGLNEPDLALLRIDIHHAEAWANGTQVKELGSWDTLRSSFDCDG